MATLEKEDEISSPFKPHPLVISPRATVNLIENLPNLKEELELGDSPIIISGQIISKAKAELVKGFFDEYESKKIPDVVPIQNSDMMEVERIQRLIRKYNSNLLITVGAGKTGDLGKILSQRAGIPHIAVYTLITSDQPISDRAVISNGNPYPYSEEAKMPDAVYIDTGMMSKADADNPHYLNSLWVDLYSKVSSYENTVFAMKNVNENVNHIALDKIRYVGQEADLLSGYLHTKEGIDKSVRLAILSGEAMNMDGSSRLASRFEHAAGHKLQNYLSKLDTNGLRLYHGDHLLAGTLFMQHSFMKHFKHSTNGVTYHRTIDNLEKIGMYSRFKEMYNNHEEVIIDSIVEAPNVRNRYDLGTWMKKIDVLRKTDVRNAFAEMGF